MMSGEISKLCAELASLGIKVNILKQWKPTQRQLEDLLRGVRKLQAIGVVEIKA